jgi:hypothetical protein
LVEEVWYEVGGVGGMVIDLGEVGVRIRLIQRAAQAARMNIMSGASAV